MIVNNFETYGAKPEFTARIALTGDPPITMIRPIGGEGEISGVTLRGYGPDIPWGVVLPGNTIEDSSRTGSEESSRATAIP